MSDNPTSVAVPPTAAQTAPAKGRRKRLQRLTKRDKIVLGFMVGIPVLIELVLIWLPTVASVGLSFTKWNGLALGDIKSAGGSNYSYIFQNYPPFWPAVRHNILWLVFLGVIATPLGLFIAVLLDRRIRGSRIYQTVFFVPVMLSLALVGIIWELMYSPAQGLVDSVIGLFDSSKGAGQPGAIDWLGDPNINIWAALIAATWKHVGYIMILYLAGLKGVDPALKEAAAIDGANERQIFFRVVFPAMRPINIVVVVVTIIESLRAFDIVWIFNKGTNGLELMSALIVQNLIGEGQAIGIGSALAVVLLVVSLVPIVIYLTRVFGKDKQP
jgi:ABC-type sugar transport system permease subunit